jgi:hypothetical protein
MGERQIAALGFVACLVLGCVATVAYLAGRVAGPRQQAVAASANAAPQATRKPEPRPAVEQLIVVEPATPPPLVALAPELQPKSPVPEPAVQDVLTGNTFWQVAATERGMAEVTIEMLTRKGLPARIGDSPSSGIFRVLVGPMRTPEETNRYKIVLDEAGFHPFIKKY